MSSNVKELNEDNLIFDAQPLKRTNFLVSFCYLGIQVLIPGLFMFFLTSRDFAFTFKLPLWLMFVLSFALLLFSLILTLFTYKFKLHQLDQFTYVVPFVFFISSLYLTSCWLNYHYFLIRFIISFAFSVVGIFLASILLLLVIKKKNLK